MRSVKVLAGLAWLGVANVIQADDADAGAKSAAPKLLNLDEYTCSHPNYRVHFFSSAPLVIYLENFITPEERSHLHALAQPEFRASTVITANGESSVESVRTSQSTSLKRDPVVTCLESRALDFQGYNTQQTNIEAIQLVKYGETERYNFHTDWFGEGQHTAAATGGNRVSSFFGYIKADNVTGGGTNFPALDPNVDERWCRFVDCDQPYDYGVSFRPIEGNAVYWGNLLESGWGDRRTTHAGLPVVQGEKIGMNIWTRQGAVSPSWRRD